MNAVTGNPDYPYRSKCCECGYEFASRFPDAARCRPCFRRDDGHLDPHDEQEEE